jgi:hypothetical protein
MENCPRCWGMLGNGVISSPPMQTSIPRPHILFIDGLPGSGKSTAAEAVGGYLSNSRVFAETAQNHPLLVAAPDRMGAAFADIHEAHSADSFAAVALGRLESFLESAGCDVLYVFESHPIQSTVRVFFQLETTILQFWSDLQDRLAFVQPRLIYFQESNPLQAMKEIFRMRGPTWESYLIEAFRAITMDAGARPFRRRRCGSDACRVCGLDRSVGRFVAVPDVEAPRSAGELRSTDRCAD